MVLLDNLGIHTPKGSRLLRALLDELRGKLVLVYTPPYDPESNRIEWLWRSLRRAVTHTHQHATLPPLLEAADTWAHDAHAPGDPASDRQPLRRHPRSTWPYRPWLMPLEQPGSI